MSAPFVVDGPMNGEICLAYLEQCVVPTLSPGEIVTMDNLKMLLACARQSKRQAQCYGCSRPIRQTSIRSNSPSQNSWPVCARAASDQSPPPNLHSRRV